MDSEAASRGTTVYLVDKRIDMLPSLLGTNLCSLRPFVERLAFSAIWVCVLAPFAIAPVLILLQEMTPEAEIVNVRFTKSVIASKAAFTYEEAQIRKDDPYVLLLLLDMHLSNSMHDRHQQDELTQSIRLLNSLALKLKAGRMAAGALNLASPEVKIQLDTSESSDPIDVEQKELRETNSLVEEFMLLANISVARKIQETFPQTAVLRRHLPPPRTNFEKLQDILMKRKGMKLDVSSSGALAASLDLCVVSCSSMFFLFVYLVLSESLEGSGTTSVQHPRSNNGYEVHALCRVFLLRQRGPRYVWSLRTCQPNIHPFHQSYPSIRRSVSPIPSFLTFMSYSQSPNPHRRFSAQTTSSSHRIRTPSRNPPLQSTRGARAGRRQPKTPHGTDGRPSVRGVLCRSGAQESGGEGEREEG